MYLYHLLCPCVQPNGTHSRNLDAESAVDPGARDAEEYSEVYGRPFRICRGIYYYNERLPKAFFFLKKERKRSNLLSSPQSAQIWLPSASFTSFSLPRGSDMATCSPSCNAGKNRVFLYVTLTLLRMRSMLTAVIHVHVHCTSEINVAFIGKNTTMNTTIS